MFLEIYKMQIRTRLTLQFLLLGGLIMVVASVAIYFSSAGFRKDDFNNRLRNKARSTANLFFDKREVDANRILEIENQGPVFLLDEKIIIINFNNDIVYNSDENSDIIIRNDVLERVRLGYNITYRQGSYDVTGTLFFTNYDRFVIIAAAVDTEGALHLEKLKLILTIVCLFSLLLFYAAGRFFAGKALKPISEVVSKVEDISITSLNLRLNEGNGTDEIGRLAKTFNSMLGRLEASFGVQKNFIANASHELRTPLTSINGQIEVLMMKERPVGEYQAALNSVLEDIKSLIDLLNRLLLIARTSSENIDNYKREIRLDEIVWQTRDDLKKFKNDYQINISIDDSVTDFDQMVVVGDEYLLKVAVSNIIDNACKYSPDKTCHIDLRHTDNRVVAVFSDNGIGISETDLKKIFEPFFRGANTLSFQGSGIGLPLVNQIIKNHNGLISITSKPGIGTEVIVSFSAKA
jgi:signal transduction histidine kinase